MTKREKTKKIMVNYREKSTMQKCRFFFFVVVVVFVRLEFKLLHLRDLGIKGEKSCLPVTVSPTGMISKIFASEGSLVYIIL